MATATSNCPACSAANYSADHDSKGVCTCRECGGIYTTRPIYTGESYEYVLHTHWATGDVPSERTRYFDLVHFGSAAPTRVHGWYDTKTRAVVQIG